MTRCVMRGDPVRLRALCATLVVAVFFGPLAVTGGAEPSAAPSAATAAGGAASVSEELVAAAAELARMPGGVVDLSGPARIPGAGLAPLLAEVAERGRAGGKTWVLIVSPQTDLGAALPVVAGRLAPGEQDIVLVASTAGVRARVPGLTGATSRIDAAFEASRRELAADLPAGLAAYVQRLEAARAERRADERMALLGLGALGLMVGLVLLGRWGRFRVSQRGWERDAAAAHARRVGACQERLHRLASAGDPEYDRRYAEFKELSERAPEDAAPGLEELARKLDAGGSR